MTAPNERVLILNGGSSSIKFQVYELRRISVYDPDRLPHTALR